MGVISEHKNKISLYYHSGNSIGKQTKAYVAASEKKILTRDLAKDKVTGTQWVEIADGLGKSVNELINKKHPVFTKLYGKQEIVMEENDWLKILDNHPETLATPIVIIGGSFHQISSPSDFNTLITSDSAGLEKGE